RARLVFQVGDGGFDLGEIAVDGFAAEADLFAFVEIDLVGIDFFQEGAEKLRELFLLRRRAPAPVLAEAPARHLLVVEDRIDRLFQALDPFFLFVGSFELGIAEYLNRFVGGRFDQLQRFAEPRSLARPESSLRSLPMRSTTDSIAELISSTTITSSQLPISSARSTALAPRCQASGTIGSSA